MNTESHEASIKRILILREYGGDGNACIELFGRKFDVAVESCNGSDQEATEILQRHEGQVDAIAIESTAVWQSCSLQGMSDKTEALVKRVTPFYYGNYVRPVIESLSLQVLAEEHPRLISGKRVLICPVMSHGIIVQKLRKYAASILVVDPLFLSNLPFVIQRVFNKLMQQCFLAMGEWADSELTSNPFTCSAIKRKRRQLEKLCQRFDLLAGDTGFILQLTAKSLHGKSLLLESYTSEELEDFKGKGVENVIRILPERLAEGASVTISAAMLEAMLGVIADERRQVMGPDFCLDELSRLSWQPEIVHLGVDGDTINKFAFITHPLSLQYLHSHPLLKWSCLLPDVVIENLATFFPSLFLSTVTGARSMSTGQKVEGYLYALPMTPRMLTSVNQKRVYRRIHHIAMRAHRRGAKIIGLGAYTSVVGDAGLTIARQSPIAVTSGNSLTVAVTIEACRKAFEITGTELDSCTAMVVGATGSIGAACSWLLAETVRRLVLVSIDPVRLLRLRERIKQQYPHLHVSIATNTAGNVAECDLIISATSAMGKRLIDIAYCKPGAVICDVSMPPDISEEEAAARPDVLVISGGQVHLPGVVNVGYDIGLPEHTVYACLAETALLAMDGRFEDYTIGRELDVERVKDMYALFIRHGGSIAGLRSFGTHISDEEIRCKWDIARGLFFIHSYHDKAIEVARDKLSQLPVKHGGEMVNKPLLRICYHLLNKRFFINKDDS